MTKRFLVPIGTDHVDFNLINNFEDAEGRLRWNSEEGTLDLGMPGGVTQALGMSFYMPPTKNNSGVQISKGSFVMATGAQGDKITIAKAVTDGTVDPMFMIGIAAENISIGSEDGLIITNGLVKGINTNSWNVGTVLYPDPATAGGLTSTKPDAPNIRTPIAIVLRKDNNNGRIYIRMTVGSTLGGTDSNVKFNNPQTGDVVVYDGVNNVWTNSSAPPTAVPTGTVLPSTGTEGVFFYNTSTSKLYFFYELWREIQWTTVEINGGTATTSEFELIVDNGNASTTDFAGSYDGGNSTSTYA
jgi:hypothetical protein